MFRFMLSFVMILVLSSVSHGQLPALPASFSAVVTNDTFGGKTPPTMLGTYSLTKTSTGWSSPAGAVTIEIIPSTTTYVMNVYVAGKKWGSNTIQGPLNLATSDSMYWRVGGDNGILIATVKYR
jgi:hypothetical protein